MSSPKLNLPMLSNFLLGEVMSSHDGVSCYPAIRRGTDEKYILKVLSIPASQSKLDALLLTGAMASKEAALEYKAITSSKTSFSTVSILLITRMVPPEPLFLPKHLRSIFLS